MTTIRISYDVSAATVAQIQEHLDQVAVTDPNWNGADFRIERDEHTCVEARDGYAGAALLSSIHSIISGQAA